MYQHEAKIVHLLHDTGATVEDNLGVYIVGPVGSPTAYYGRSPLYTIGPSLSRTS